MAILGWKWVEMGQIRAKSELNMVGNVEKNQNLDWNAQEIMRKQVKMAI